MEVYMIPRDVEQWLIGSTKFTVTVGRAPKKNPHWGLCRNVIQRMKSEYKNLYLIKSLEKENIGLTWGNGC